MEFPSALDPTVFFGNVASQSSVDTTFPNSTCSQAFTTTTLHGFSSQALFGDIANEVPQALPLRERYIDSFYENFYAAHPFIPPKELLLILSQQISLEPLLAAIRWIGSLYIDRDNSDSLLTDASHQIDGAPLRNGFLVQAMLLVIIGLDGNRQEKRARKLLEGARDISIQIKLNSDPFAVTNGQGIPILEESWRRTWWELYVVDALMSGVHQTNTFFLYDVPTDVALPCEEHQYLTGVSLAINPRLRYMLTRSSKYLPLFTHMIRKPWDCLMPGHFRRTPIGSNVPVSWVPFKRCHQTSTISPDSWLTGCSAYPLQNMTLTAMAS